MAFEPNMDCPGNFEKALRGKRNRAIGRKAAMMITGYKITSIWACHNIADPHDVTRAAAAPDAEQKRHTLATSSQKASPRKRCPKWKSL